MYTEILGETTFFCKSVCITQSDLLWCTSDTNHFGWQWPLWWRNWHFVSINLFSLFILYEWVSYLPVYTVHIKRHSPRVHVSLKLIHHWFYHNMMKRHLAIKECLHLVNKAVWVAPPRGCSSCSLWWCTFSSKV